MSNHKNRLLKVISAHVLALFAVALCAQDLQTDYLVLPKPNAYKNPTCLNYYDTGEKQYMNGTLDPSTGKRRYWIEKYCASTRTTPPVLAAVMPVGQPLENVFNFAAERTKANPDLKVDIPDLDPAEFSPSAILPNSAYPAGRTVTIQNAFNSKGGVGWILNAKGEIVDHAYCASTEICDNNEKILYEVMLDNRERNPGAGDFAAESVDMPPLIPGVSEYKKVSFEEERKTYDYALRDIPDDYLNQFGEHIQKETALLTADDLRRLKDKESNDAYQIEIDAANSDIAITDVLKRYFGVSNTGALIPRK